MNFSSTPHGNILVNRMAAEKDRAALLKEAAALPAIILNERGVGDLDMLASGALSPLVGFMGARDYNGVVGRMHLANGLPWSIPITLSVKKEEEGKYREGTRLALKLVDGMVLAILDLQEKFSPDKKKEASLVYRTEDPAHPGVAALQAQGEIYLAGPVHVLNRILHKDFPQHWNDPADLRRIFAERKWKRVVGFQTRNPVHRAHEYIQKCALEIVDGLLLHPLVGATKGDDIPANVRMKCYEVLLNGYYPKDRALLSVMPAPMRYAGPREAIFHAIVRKNYGCTHFIVGRDHAGVGNYYGTYDAHTIFDEFEPGELGITPLFFDHTFYCKACGQMASAKTCPHAKENHVTLSGTQVRQFLQEGKIPPVEFSRPEVAKILIESTKN